MESPECARCGKQIITSALSGDFCSECASKIRGELALSFQIKHAWIQLRKPLWGLPFVTLALVMVNIGVYLLVKGSPELSLVLEMNGRSVIHGQWWRLLTAAFLHLSTLHLVLNCIFLCVLGSTVERVTGHSKLLLLWIASGVAGSLAELFSRPQLFALGASGVVYGLAGALLYICLFKQETLPDKRPYRLAAMLGLFVIISFLAEWHDRGRLNPAHIGGVLGGFVFALMILSIERGRQNKTRSS